MPIYEYTCKDCGKRFEELVRSSLDQASSCPVCGSKKVARAFSTFSAAVSTSGSSKSCDFGLGGGGGHCCSGPGCCG